MDGRVVPLYSDADSGNDSGQEMNQGIDQLIDDSARE